MRALSICKIGGFVLYSTCSINPIEDEAVVMEAFNRVLDKNSFLLVDIHNNFPKIKGRKGLNKWNVYVQQAKNLKLIEKWENCDNKESNC